MDPIRRRPGDIRKKSLQVISRVDTADRGRRGDEAYVRRIHVEAVQHTPEEQGHLGGLGADVGVGLVEHDPAELAARLIEYRPILGADEHVLQHRRVGDEHGGRILAERLSRNLLCTRARLFVGRRRLRGLAVVETEPDVASEAAAPGSKAVTLTVDERVQRVQKQCPYAGQSTGSGALAGQILEDRYEEALGLPGAGAARDQYRSGRVVEQEPPAGELVLKRLSRAGKCVFVPVLARWPGHRRYEFLAKQTVSGQTLHVHVGLLPAERRFEHRIGQQGAGLAGSPGIQVLQVPA